MSIPVFFLFLDASRFAVFRFYLSLFVRMSFVFVCVVGLVFLRSLLDERHLMESIKAQYFWFFFYACPRFAFVVVYYSALARHKEIVQKASTDDSQRCELRRMHGHDHFAFDVMETLQNNSFSLSFFFLFFFCSPRKIKNHKEKLHGRSQWTRPTDQPMLVQNAFVPRTPKIDRWKSSFQLDDEDTEKRIERSGHENDRMENVGGEGRARGGGDSECHRCERRIHNVNRLSFVHSESFSTRNYCYIRLDVFDRHDACRATFTWSVSTCRPCAGALVIPDAAIPNEETHERKITFDSVLSCFLLLPFIFWSFCRWTNVWCEVRRCTEFIFVWIIQSNWIDSLRKIWNIFRPFHARKVSECTLAGNVENFPCCDGYVLSAHSIRIWSKWKR